MAKSRKKRNEKPAAPPVRQPVTSRARVDADTRELSPWLKRLVSVALLGYLLVLVLGPLSNPLGSEFLTRPLAEMVSPLHRMLFLGHGYRFFGPDPGASHLVVYRIMNQDGDLMEGHFPDRDQHRPRLLYHRWFMLSESVFNEHAMTPDKKSFETTDAELAEQIKALRTNGKTAMANRLVKERKKRNEQYADTRKRIDELVSSIAGYLMEKNDGQQIELFVQERSIPFAIQRLTGTKLDDPQFLSPLKKIGEFQRDSSGKTVSLEDLANVVEGGP